jgi:hypothetical protein
VLTAINLGILDEIIKPRLMPFAYTALSYNLMQRNGATTVSASWFSVPVTLWTRVRQVLGSDHDHVTGSPR